MGRKIDLEINGNTFTIEYDRASVYKYIANKEDSETITIEDAVDLVYFGLLKNHEEEMPTKDDIFGWLLGIEDLTAFYTEVTKSIEEVLTAIEQDKKGNVKWGVRN